MSKKFKAALQSGTVTLRSKSAGEVSVWYIDRSNKRAFTVLRPFATKEMAPKMTDAARLRHSNIEDLVRKGLVAIQ